MTPPENKKPIYILGGGGHAHVIYDIIQKAGNYDCAGFIVPSKNDFKIPLLKTLPIIIEKDFLADKTHHADAALAIGIGENWTRKQIYQRLQNYNFKFPALIHPSATIAENATIGQGSVVMPGSIINAGACIGDFCVINSGAIIEHDSKLENYATAGPASIICGNCSIGENSYIGAGATIIQGKTIGADSVIGAGAVIINNAEKNSLYTGNPARYMRSRNPSEKIL